MFDLQVSQILPTKSTGILVQEKNIKIDFQDGCHDGHLGFPICTILAIFNLKVTSGLQMKVSNQLAIWLRRRITKYIFKSASMAAILDFLLERLRYFSSTSYPSTSYHVWSQLAIPFRRRDRNIFLIWGWWWPSWFSDRNKCRFLSTCRHDTSYQVLSQMAFGFWRNVVQSRFSRWWWWISDQNLFIYFWSTSRPDTSY